eukprot:3414057-Amphidinium_carterae.1
MAKTYEGGIPFLRMAGLGRRSGHGWGDLPTSGGACSPGLQVWDCLDKWQEPGKGTKVAGLLQPGHIIEATVTSGGGRVLGHLLLHIVAVHLVDGSGVALEVSACGESNKRLQEWAVSVHRFRFASHSCVCASKKGCKFGAGTRVVLHVHGMHRWRLRNPITVKEP